MGRIAGDIEQAQARLEEGLGMALKVSTSGLVPCLMRQRQ